MRDQISKQQHHHVTNCVLRNQLWNFFVYQQSFQVYLQSYSACVVWKNIRKEHLGKYEHKSKEPVLQSIPRCTSSSGKFTRVIQKWSSEKTNTLCDVIICVEDERYPCHRNSMAACSPYFFAMFTGEMRESHEREVRIDGISPDIMEQLIDFAYTADISITQENAQQLLSAANLVQINTIIQACCNFLEEEIVLDAVLKWVKHDQKRRIAELSDVLQFVRLPLVSPYFLFDKLDTEELLMMAPGCRKFLDEAMKYHILKDRRMEMSSPRVVPRRCMAVETIVYITGGEIYNRNYLNCVEGYNLENGTWMKLKDLPFSRCHHCSVVSEDMHLYIAGGCNKEKVVVNNVMRYERYLDKWIKVASLNTPRAKFGMAALDGYIYAIGGFDGTSRLSTVERYCPKTNKWSFVASLTQPTSRIFAVGLNGFLYAAGGDVDPGNSSMVDTFIRYNPVCDVWENLKSMSFSRAVSGLVTLKGKIYAVGGITEGVYSSKDLECYDTDTDVWTNLSPMMESRFDPGVTAFNNQIFVLGGNDGGNSFYSNIESYDTTDDKWKVMASLTLPYGRCRFTAVAMGTQQT
ncbi:unnamed protein product [Mytilus coruscus]|uniref:BTB domain-containing protein n=1 Tax=Mytilus coruscus TaxID=42192 RepID=A0A6J7ZUI5_MYTCO|nr:unnamed protein product [Mytilus coruscus]